MPGLAFFLGVGFSLLGLLYTGIVLFGRDATYGAQRQPYLWNGIALCILGVSLLGRDHLLPIWIVYPLWAVAGYLAIKAMRAIRATGKDQ